MSFDFDRGMALVSDRMTREFCRCCDVPVSHCRNRKRQRVNYIVIADNEGILAARRRSASTALTEDEALSFVMRTLHLDRLQISGSLERAPEGARQIQVYLSNAPDGIGRIGRNWVPLAIQADETQLDRSK